MTRLGGVRNNTRGGGNQTIGSKNPGASSAPLRTKELGLEEQRVWELLEALKALNDLEGRKRILDVAEVKDPVTPKALKIIAELFASLEMPLTVQGLATFKLERGLSGGTSIAGNVAQAYVRALDGEEILFRVTRLEERHLRPSEKAVLKFLREMAEHSDASELGPVKRALGLGNPPLEENAELLENEYVGLSTLSEIARATTIRDIPVSRSGMKKLVSTLRKERGRPPRDDDE